MTKTGMAPIDVFSTLTNTGQDINFLTKKYDLEKIIDYYCNYGDRLRNFLTEGHHYIKGRRGTGKTALMARAYTECVLSWDSSYLERPDKALTRERVLGVYIDLYTATRSLIGNNESLEYTFVETLLNAIIDQVSGVMQPGRSQSKGLFTKMLNALSKGGRVSKHKTEALNEFEKAKESLKEANYLPRMRTREKKINRHPGKKIDFNLTPASGINVSVLSQSKELENYRVHEGALPLAAARILKEIENSRKKAGISAIYVFLDEFSNLSSRNKAGNWEDLYDLQKRLTGVLKSLFGGVNIYFKIAVITDRYTLGHLEPQQDISEISLDIPDIFKLAKDFKDGMKKLEAMTRTILENRLKVFAPGTHIEDLFAMDPDVAIRILTRASMCVPRTLGYILTYANQKAKGPIDEPSLREGLIEYHYKMRKRLSDPIGSDRIYSISYERLWKKMLERSEGIQKNFPHIPSSHFYCHSRYDQYLRPLRENYLIHLIQKNFEPPGIKLGRRDLYDLYSLDYAATSAYSNYGLPDIENIELWKQLNFDSIIEPYFSEEEETYRCEECGKKYYKSDYSDHGIPRFCTVDGKKLQLVISDDDSTRGIEKQLLEVELQILQFLITTPIPLKAIEIAGNIDGCSFQKVAWFAKLHPEWITRKRQITYKKRTPFIYCKAN